MSDSDKLRDAFRRGFAGVFDAGQLRALAEACERDDPRLINTGRTTWPPRMAGTKNDDLECEGACAIAFAAVGGAYGTVGDVNRAFSGAVTNIARPGLKSPFLDLWDTMPRAEAFGALALECRSMLAELAEPVAA